MNRRCLAAFLAAALIVAYASDMRAQTASPEDILKQYVADLQKNPNDYALREKIIRHVQTMKPAPAIPESARRHYVKGSTLYDDSKNPSESADASEEFRQSLLIAPWWGDAYMKMGLALESSNRYDEAIAALKLFIATNPKDDVLRRAQDEIYKIEARAQKAAKPPKHSAAEDSQSTAERKQDPFETLLRKIDGRRYRETRGGPAVLEVRGKSLALMGPGVSGGPWEIIGRIARTARVMQSPPLPVQTTFTISEAGDRIIEHREFSDGDVREFTWLWQR